jgi:superfamily II DNA or RNA helicase
MFGFFSSGSLREIAPGLAEFIAGPKRTIQMIISPHLNADDIRALDEGTSTSLDVMSRRLQELLGEARVTANALSLHTLTCLSYLLASGRIEIRIARVRNGLFHPKVWIFKSDSDTMIAHGSSNLTVQGLTRNVEIVRIEKSWKGLDQKEVIDTFRGEFDTLWANRDPATEIMPIPQAIRERILQEFTGDRPPTPGDFEATQAATEATAPAGRANQTLTIPPGLNYSSGPFRHQGDAVIEWERAGRKGILAMATGSGKTITALIAAKRLLDSHKPLFLVISAPYKVLITQWEDEVRLFGVEPVPLGAQSNNSSRVARLGRAVDALRVGAAQIEVAIVTEDLLTDNSFRAFLAAVPNDVNTMLIADEVHNLGALRFTSDPPTRFDFRLGLSATPRRQYDPAGTALLFNFFGPPVFEYTLEQAIGTCLVRYEYFLHPVELTEFEFQDWKDKTAQLGRAGFGADDADPSDSGPMSADVQRLLNARRAILESAERKMPALRTSLSDQLKADISHTLIYTTDKNPQQLIDVNLLLQADLGILFHQLTAEETAAPDRAKVILARFADGQLQVLTCKRVLDEGVNIPQIVRAHLLASNTVERQWIQRRGRILRKCAAIDKQLAYLHDYIVVPPVIDAGSRGILMGELKRAHEFARLAENAGDRNGPLDVIQRLTP